MVKGENTMKRELIDCLRCKIPMRFLGEQKIQLGKTGWILGDLPNLFAGALDVKIFQCPICGKLEFFSTENMAQNQDRPKATRKNCPECGAEHDEDCECCPICGYSYIEQE